jgi:hypothetical protein
MTDEKAQEEDEKAQEEHEKTPGGAQTSCSGTMEEGQTSCSGSTSCSGDQQKTSCS